MSAGVFTLKEFFGFSELSSDQRTAIGSKPEMLSIGALIASKVPGIGWPAAFEEIIRRIGDLLDVGIPEIAAAAWNEYRVLKKYTDGKEYPPDQTFLVTLTKHTIESTHRPAIEVLLDQKVVGRIGFDIDLELTLEGVILKIRDAKIVGMQVGSCSGKGTVKCESFVILEKESESFRLPGSMVLGAGIAIGRPTIRGRYS